jgi:hypothetical protein
MILCIQLPVSDDAPHRHSSHILRQSLRLLRLLILLALSGCGRGVEPAPAPDATTQVSIVPTASPDADLWSLNAAPDKSVRIPVPRSARPDDWFDEISKQSGVQFTYCNGREGNKYTLMESVGGGTALFDFDSDNVLDLFVTGGGTIKGSPIEIGGLPSAFYRNRNQSLLMDIMGLSRISTLANYTIGCSVCDYNCDGYPDLYVTGYPHSYLFRNQGDGTFLDVSETSSLSQNGLRTASTWGDFDGDGLADLFVSGYVLFDLREDRSCGEDLRRIRDICGIWQYPAAPDRLFHNRGDGSFEETTESARLRSDGKGLGAVAADFNGDGLLDIYVGNDFTPNFLYLGDGTGKFEEQGLVSGSAVDANGAPQGSMGVDFGDYDGDGQGDLFVTNYQLEDNTLYRNLGNAAFAVTTAQCGLQDTCRPYVGFGTGWVDWDSDGWLDLFVLNGHVMYHTGQSPYEQPQFLFRNVSGERFVNLSEQGGPYFSVPHAARGGSAGDLDNNGTSDLIVVHQNSPVSILRNRLSPKPWVSVCLRGTSSDPFAIGSVITARFAGRTLTRHVRSGAGYLSHFDRRVLLPIDGEGATECSVRWLNGKQEVFQNLQPGRTHQLIEGHGLTIPGP